MFAHTPRQLPLVDLAAGPSCVSDPESESASGCVGTHDLSHQVSSEDGNGNSDSVGGRDRGVWPAGLRRLRSRRSGRADTSHEEVDMKVTRIAAAAAMAGAMGLGALGFGSAVAQADPHGPG